VSELSGRDYTEGRRFRVAKEGARFEGLLLHGEQTIAGWSRRISLGEVLTCLGWKSVDALGVSLKGVMWTGAKVPDSAIVMQIWPFESIFRPYPLTGYLVPYIDPDDEEAVAKELATMPSLDQIEDGVEVDLTSHLPIIEKKPVSDEVVDLSGF